MTIQQARVAEPAALPSGAVLNSIEQFIRDELRLRLGAFLDQAEKTLGESWRHSSNPADWTGGREAVEWLARHKPVIQDTMYTRLVQGLGGAEQPRLMDLSDLRLMNVEELAVTLARAKLVSRVMDQAKATVRELEARLETLSAARIRVNPRALGPGHLADCFQTILQENAVPPKAQTVLMDAFGERSTDQIIKFYEGMNALLHSHGVAPTFPSVGLSVAALQDKLQPLQETVTQLPATSWKPGQLREQFERQISSVNSEPERPILSPAQARQIDHIEAFFLEILQDPNISDRIRAELSRLILPLMAARLPESEYFSSPDSPVRVFVRQLALLGYRDQEVPLQDFDLIQALISRIVSEGGQVLDSFHGGAEALYTLARRQVRKMREQRSGENVEQNPEARNAATRLSLAEEARKQVMIELRENAAGLVLLQPVQLFILRLLGPWMMVRYQRYGEGSQPWAEARAFAALFFDALRLAVDEKEQIRKRALRRQTLVQARVRTERSNAPVDRSADLLVWLEQHFDDLNQRLYTATSSRAAPVAATGMSFLESLPVLGST
jgi:hypothetical protein